VSNARAHVSALSEVALDRLIDAAVEAMHADRERAARERADRDRAERAERGTPDPVAPSNASIERLMDDLQRLLQTLNATLEQRLEDRRDQ
jgi:predicted Zn-dependent protease